MPNVNQIIIGVVVLAVVAVGAFLLFTGQIAPTQDEPQSEALAPGTLSIAGSVVSVSSQNGSFVMKDQKSGQEFTVTLGEATEFVILDFPFDLASPPPELESFTPERREAVIQDLQGGDFVFVRSSHEIMSGEEVLDPIEIQILP